MIKIKIHNKPSLCENCQFGCVMTHKNRETISLCTYHARPLKIKDVVTNCTMYEFKYGEDDPAMGLFHSEDDKWKKEGLLIIGKKELRRYGIYL